MILNYFSYSPRTWKFVKLILFGFFLLYDIYSPIVKYNEYNINPKYTLSMVDSTHNFLSHQWKNLTRSRGRCICLSTK